MFFITLTTVLLSVVLASVIEGLLHQFILHTPNRRFLWGVLYGAFHSHSIEHHPNYRADSYHRPAPEEESKISLGWYTLPLILLFVSPLIYTLWAFFGIWPAAALVIVFIAYYSAYEFLHWYMHFPRGDGRKRWFVRFRPTNCIFAWFDKRHYVHHLADDRNFNVVLPIYDLLTGRYTTDIAKAPWAIRIRTRRNKRRAEQIRRRLQKT